MKDHIIYHEETTFSTYRGSSITIYANGIGEFSIWDKSKNYSDITYLTDDEYNRIITQNNLENKLDTNYE